MTIEEIKAEVAKLTDAEQEQLVGYLNCLAVTRDPEWQAAIHESTERHGDRLAGEGAMASMVTEDTPQK